MSNLLGMFGFGFLLLAMALYSSFPVLIQSNAVWLGLLSASSFYLISFFKSAKAMFHA